jgi:Uma2 family endonuclease
MVQASMLEPPVVVHTRPAIDMDDEQFFQFCRLNRDLQIERTADGDILIMTPEAGSSGRGSSRLTALFDQWAERDGTGQVFGSSTGFRLRNGAVRSPDVAWVRNEQLAILTDEEWNRFLPLCPDFVLELRSPSDSIELLQQKMEEYRDNGARLGWLLDPMTKRVHVYQLGASVEVHEKPSVMSGDPLLQGFRLALEGIWAAIERRRA